MTVAVFNDFLMSLCCLCRPCFMIFDMVTAVGSDSFTGESDAVFFFIFVARKNKNKSRQKVRGGGEDKTPPVYGVLC